MSHVFPKNKLKEKDPISKSEVNENLQEIVGEIQGNLGEQNWSDGVFTRARVAEGAVSRIHSKQISGARYFTTGSTPMHPHRYSKSTDTTSYHHNLNHVLLPTNRTWTPIISFEISCRSSLLWIMASFQQDYYDVD